MYEFDYPFLSVFDKLYLHVQLLLKKFVKYTN